MNLAEIQSVHWSKMVRFLTLRGEFMTPNPRQKMTLEEYFEFDKKAEGNFEYFDGDIFEMSGVSPNHARIERNLTLNLTPKAFEKGCEAFPANLRIKIP